MSCVIYVFCLLVVFVRLSVLVQVIGWKDFVSEMTYKVFMCIVDDKPYSLTHAHQMMTTTHLCF